MIHFTSVRYTFSLAYPDYWKTGENLRQMSPSASFIAADPSGYCLCEAYEYRPKTRTSPRQLADILLSWGKENQKEFKILATGAFAFGRECDRWHTSVSYLDGTRSGSEMVFVVDQYLFDLGSDLLSVNFKVLESCEQSFRPTIESIVRSVSFPKDAAKPLPAVDRCGAMFWFEWGRISEAGHSMYGRYIYGAVLPLLIPIAAKTSSDWLLLDGDCFMQPEFRWPEVPAGEVACLQKIMEDEPSRCCVVGIYGAHDAFAKLDAGLRAPIGPLGRTDAAIGYLGKLTFPTLAEESYLKLCESMALVPAMRIRDHRVKKISFGFQSDKELGALGLDVVE